VPRSKIPGQDGREWISFPISTQCCSFSIYGNWPCNGHDYQRCRTIVLHQMGQNHFCFDNSNTLCFCDCFPDISDFLHIVTPQQHGGVARSCEGPCVDDVFVCGKRFGELVTITFGGEFDSQKSEETIFLVRVICLPSVVGCDCVAVDNACGFQPPDPVGEGLPRDATSISKLRVCYA